MNRFKVKKEEGGQWWVMQWAGGLWWPMESFHSKAVALEEVAQRRKEERECEEDLISAPVREGEREGREDWEDEGEGEAED